MTPPNTGSFNQQIGYVASEKTHSERGDKTDHIRHYSGWNQQMYDAISQAGNGVMQKIKAVGDQRQPLYPPPVQPGIHPSQGTNR